MSIYISIALLASLFMLISRLISPGNKIGSKIIVCFSFLFLWIISAFRYNVGTDFFYYYTYINRIENIQVNDNEYGTYLLGQLVALFTNEGQIFIAVTSFIIIFLIFKTIYKESSHPELSILLFLGLGYYFTSLNILQQYIALSIVFYSVRYLFEKKTIYFVVAIVVASLFHFSAIIGILYLFIVKIYKKNFLSNIFIVAGFFIVIIFYESIIPLLIPNQYSMYQSTNFVNEGANIAFFIIYLLITLVIYFFRKELTAINNKNEYYLVFILIGTGFTLLGTQSLIIMRVADYFTIFTILILPDLIKIVKDVNMKAVLYLSLLSLSLCGIFIFLKRNLGEVVPYNFFF